ncbi:hypothetical protein DH2020_015664 [Rehmannia glutinosa]|uniref:AAA+ ATPase domain-containing protein n=1 Tax=Rehmannia glutinosa TaxID=99300 RepID=A0ABR0WWL0_REHGL
MYCSSVLLFLLSFFESSEWSLTGLEEFERKANVQLERQLMMASEWSRTLLTMRGKLKGTEWDPESSHCIDYSDFKRLLDSNNVRYMEYSNYGQTVSVILPYYKDGKTEGSEGDRNKEIVFRRHVVDQVYSTVATAVVWSMRLALSVALYVWIDNMTRPIYAKLIPCDLGAPPKKNDIAATQARGPWVIREESMLLETSVPKTHQLIFITTQSFNVLNWNSLYITCELQDFLVLVSVSFNRNLMREEGAFKTSFNMAKFISAEEKTGVTFDDFAGQEYIKRELQEIVRILKNDEEFQNKGIYCPKGVLLHGPPGTGKTLLAKAIAGEAGLPFLQLMMFVGVAASRVKDLFASARSFAPSIIFIDEIDAIGSKRGGPDIGGVVLREQGLLQILTEMDGFKVSTSQVLVIGATNRLDILDPALLRKGRFDKIIRVGLPSKDGRFAILKSLYVPVGLTGDRWKCISILFCCSTWTSIMDSHQCYSNVAAKGTFETGQEDSTEVPEELKLRLAYREAAVAVLACYIPDPYLPFTDTDINSIRSQPNMRYQETSGRVFQRKADYVDSIVRACARKLQKDITDCHCLITLKFVAMYARKSCLDVCPCVIGLKVTSMLILPDLIGNQMIFAENDLKQISDFLILLLCLAAKLEALREEYMRFAVEKCSSVLREYRHAVENITGWFLLHFSLSYLLCYYVLLEKGEIKADEIWKIYNSSPRIPQPAVKQVDEYGALLYAGRWGLHGVSLPGRVTFAPGNVGFATFGAPRPMETQIISDNTWKLIDGIWDKRVQEIRARPPWKLKKTKITHNF